MIYNPNHPVHCSCPQCSWWSLSGASYYAQSEGFLNNPLQSRIISDLNEPSARNKRILMLFLLSGFQPTLEIPQGAPGRAGSGAEPQVTEKIESRASASRNFSLGVDGWV